MPLITTQDIEELSKGKPIKKRIPGKAEGDVLSLDTSEGGSMQLTVVDAHDNWVSLEELN